MKNVLAVLLILVATSALAGERTYDREFPVEAGARFSLDTHKGNIKIRTDDGSTIRVHARFYPDQGKNPELLEKLMDRETDRLCVKLYGRLLRLVT